MFPSYCCNYRGKLFNANFLVLGNLECSETICLQKSFFHDHLFLTAAFSSWKIAIATSAACESKVSAERIDHLILSFCYTPQGACWGWHSELV